MKMKNNNGYTLTELLLTIAIFSVVMVSIFALLRSTSVSYKNENADVMLQEEAQIIVNQIEEYLVDCNQKVEKKGNGYYCIQSKDSTGQHYYYFKLDNTDNCLYFTESSSSISDDSDVDQLMAEYVKSFSIDGLEFADTSTGDNACVVNIEMKSNTSPDIIVDNGDGTTSTIEGEGYKYQTAKTVYFRNNIENLSNHVITGASTGGTTSSNDVSVDVKRYQLINVSSLGLSVDTSSSSLGLSLTQPDGMYTFYYCLKDSSDNIDIDNMTELGASINLTDAQLDNIHDCTADVYVTTASALIASPYSTSYAKSIAKGSYYISSGSSKVFLTTKAVDFDNGSGILYIPNKKIDNGGTCDLLKVDGFDIASYIHYWGGTAPTFSCQMYKDSNGNKKFDSGEEKLLKNSALPNNCSNDSYGAATDLSIGRITFDSGKIVYPTGSKASLWESKYFFSLGAMEENSSDVCITIQNETGLNLHSYTSCFSDGKVRVYFKIDLPNKTYTVDYMLGTSGMTVPTGMTYGKNVY